MIQIIPSIAILEGKILRLKDGKYFADRHVADSPVDLAREFEQAGIKVVHIVDLDGAKRGRPVNYHILEAIAGHTNLKVDFSGGINTDGDISKAFEYGASYITAASIAAVHPRLFSSWVISYGREKITLGADCRDKKLEIRGWLKKTDISVMPHIEQFYNIGLKYVKTTDIDRDGAMVGPSLDLYRSIIQTFTDIKVLASGGVRNMEDIKTLHQEGIYAVIIGKALYEGAIQLDDIAQFISQESVA